MFGKQGLPYTGRPQKHDRIQTRNAPIKGGQRKHCAEVVDDLTEIGKCQFQAWQPILPARRHLGKFAILALTLD